MSTTNFDIKIYSQLINEFTIVRNVPAGTAISINAGEPTKAVDASNASPYLGTVAIMADGDGTTSQRFSGIAKEASTDTVAAAGTVITWLPLPGMIYSGKAKLATAVNTLAKLVTYFGKQVIFDLTAGVWTVDTEAAGASTNCLVIVGGEWQTSTVYFWVSQQGTMMGS